MKKISTGGRNIYKWEEVLSIIETFTNEKKFYSSEKYPPIRRSFINEKKHPLMLRSFLIRGFTGEKKFYQSTKYLITVRNIY